MEKVLRINVGAENGPVATIEELGRIRGPWRARYDDRPSYATKSPRTAILLVLKTSSFFLPA